MNKITIILWIFFGIGLIGCQRGKHVILSENSTIVLPSNADKWEQKAATELQSYLKKIGDVDIAIGEALKGETINEYQQDQRYSILYQQITNYKSTLYQDYR